MIVVQLNSITNTIQIRIYRHSERGSLLVSSLCSSRGMVVHEQTIFGTSLGDREVVIRFARMIPLPVLKVECVFSACGGYPGFS